ncbi:MAG: alpha-galactosidase [Clostridia bacterium]|nr:alpha-galactosidase [Clostridia bacterium]
MIIRLPDIACVYGEDNSVLFSSAENIENDNVVFSARIENDMLIPSVTSNEIPLCYIVLKWLFKNEEKRSEPVKILSDHWERGYGDLAWQGVSHTRHMPWYFLVSNGSDSNTNYSGRHTEGFGVKVRPSSFCCWQYDTGGVTLHIDIRCGCKGVILNGRTLDACEVIFTDYYNISAFESGQQFCRSMCTDPVFPKEPVYGFNNWYYAYGVSSEEEIIRDTDYLAHCTQGLSSPFMVIDDCWQPNRCDGPWHCGNDKFPDMKQLANEIKIRGVRPGVWLRPLRQKNPFDEIPENWRLPRDITCLDPSNDEVLDYIENTFSRIVDWGYELIKFDFITYDIFGRWGKDSPDFMSVGSWTFKNRNKTSAEIIIDLYRRIRKGSKGAILIGCNAIGHLCAGIVEINRTGDDTSGLDWQRTRVMGVNTLAFRALHNQAFYMSDADCAAITSNVKWSLNAKWLKILSASGSPLFISWDIKVNSPEIIEAVKNALSRNSVQRDVLIPLDWMENTCPERWQLNGEEIYIDWFEDLTDNIIKPL